MEDLKTLFYKVRRIKVPILLIHPVIFPIQVQLIHSEGHQKILWLPLFLIGILILHPQLPHDPAASRIMHIVGGRDIGDAASTAVQRPCLLP